MGAWRCRARRFHATSSPGGPSRCSCTSRISRGSTGGSSATGGCRSFPRRCSCRRCVYVDLAVRRHPRLRPGDRRDGRRRGRAGRTLAVHPAVPAAGGPRNGARHRRGAGRGLVPRPSLIAAGIAVVIAIDAARCRQRLLRRCPVVPSARRLGGVPHRPGREARMLRARVRVLLRGRRGRRARRRALRTERGRRAGRVPAHRQRPGHAPRADRAGRRSPPVARHGARGRRR